MPDEVLSKSYSDFGFNQYLEVPQTQTSVASPPNELNDFEISGVAGAQSGSGAPTQRPTSLSQVYVDTASSKVYVSTGIASSSDWTIVN